MPDRTDVANAAIALSDMYGVHCAKLTVHGDVPRRPILSIPAGPSTEGGKLARQHISLDPGAAPAAKVTVGWVELPTHRASLKTFTCLLDAHRTRFGDRPFPLDGVGYERFLEMTMSFLKNHGFTIEMERRPTLPPPASPANRPSWLLPAVVTGVIAVGLALWLALL